MIRSLTPSRGPSNIRSWRAPVLFMNTRAMKAIIRCRISWAAHASRNRNNPRLPMRRERQRTRLGCANRRQFTCIAFFSLLVMGAVSRARPAPAFEVASVKVLVRGPQPIQRLYEECHNDSYRALDSKFGIVRWAYDLHWPQGAEMEGQLPAWTRQPGGAFALKRKLRTPVSVG